jgi:hypothetical protein
MYALDESAASSAGAAGDRFSEHGEQPDAQRASRVADAKAGPLRPPGPKKSASAPTMNSTATAARPPPSHTHPMRVSNLSGLPV